MPRPPRADEAGGLYHALNRGNLRATLFHKDADYEAFERILYEVHLGFEWLTSNLMDFEGTRGGVPKESETDKEKRR